MFPNSRLRKTTSGASVALAPWDRSSGNCGPSLPGPGLRYSFLSRHLDPWISEAEHNRSPVAFLAVFSTGVCNPIYLCVEFEHLLIAGAKNSYHFHIRNQYLLQDIADLVCFSK